MNRKLIILLLGSGNYAKKGTKYVLFVKKESPNMNRKLNILLLDSGNYAKKGTKYVFIC